MISDLDRRTIGQLGQPRNVHHLTHELRVDPGAETPSDTQEVHDRLLRLKEAGLVVNLGTHANASKAVKRLPRASMPLHDEACKLFESRLMLPHRQWRLDGDLWIVSKEGILALKEPAVDEPPPMTATEVQALINAEWDRTIADLDAKTYDKKYAGCEKPDGPRLAHRLLADEFMAWAIAVADDCQKRWGERPVLPLAGGAGWGNAYENLLLDDENQKTRMPASADPWYMALTILAFTDTDTGTTADDGSHVPTYTGWARKSVAGSDMAAASSGSAANTSAITFAGCTAGSSTILGFGNCSTSTGGTLRKYGTCSSTAISTTQTPASFAVSAYATTAD